MAHNKSVLVSTLVACALGLGACSGSDSAPDGNASSATATMDPAAFNAGATSEIPLVALFASDTCDRCAEELAAFTDLKARFEGQVHFSHAHDGMAGRWAQADVEVDPTWLFAHADFSLYERHEGPLGAAGVAERVEALLEG